jgi:hypothetical protein
MPSQTSLRRTPAAQPENEVSDPFTETASVAPWLTIVADKVKSIRYGVVQIVVHDSKVVQIERTDRTRFEVPPAAQGR